MNQIKNREVSFCIISKNEEKFLKNALFLPKKYCNEIIYVDTGSTDHSIEIAKNFSDRIFNFPWTNDFSEAKNFALDKANSEWILFLDADEELEEGDYKKIREHLLEQPFDAFNIRIHNYTNDTSEQDWQNCEKIEKFDNAFYGFVETRLCRLFRNDRRIRYQGAVHELIEPSLIEGNFKISDGSLTIHHYGRVKETTPDSVKTRYKNYLKPHQKKVLENPRDWKANYELAVNYLMLAEYDSAASFFEKSLLLRGNLPDIFLHYSVNSFRQGNFALMNQLIENGLRKFPLNRNLRLMKIFFLIQTRNFKEGLKEVQSIETAQTDYHLNLLKGILFLNLEQFELSEKCLKICEHLNPLDHRLEFYLGIYNFKIKEFQKAVNYLEKVNIFSENYEKYYYLGLSQFYLNEFTKSVENLKKAFMLKQDNADLAFQLGVAILKTENTPEAIKYFETAGQLNPKYNKFLEKIR